MPAHRVHSVASFWLPRIGCNCRGRVNSARGITTSADRSTRLAFVGIKRRISVQSIVYTLTTRFRLNIEIEKDLSGSSPNTTIELYCVNSDGNVAAVERIATHELSRRWDYTYWKWVRTRATGVTNMATLADLGGELFRGHLSRAEARRLELPHFHTTDFARLRRHSIAFRSETQFVQQLPRELRAGPGDILIPRIGTRCLGHQAMVSRGTAAITDCVYRIRLAPQHRKATLLSLASEQGVDWRQKSARGTCAKFLTRTDMMRFPVQLI